MRIKIFSLSILILSFIGCTDFAVYFDDGSYLFWGGGCSNSFNPSTKGEQPIHGVFGYRTFDSVLFLKVIDTSICHNNLPFLESDIKFYVINFKPTAKIIGPLSNEIFRMNWMNGEELDYWIEGPVAKNLKSL
jgi:hypothetical protein